MSTEKGSLQKQPELLHLKTCKALSVANPMEDDIFLELFASLERVESLPGNEDFDPAKSDFGTRQVPREIVTISR